MIAVWAEVLPEEIEHSGESAEVVVRADVEGEVFAHTREFFPAGDGRILKKR